MRVRGLKLMRLRIFLLILVAPRAGAWIETSTLGLGLDSEAVAPRAGAWIETKVKHKKLNDRLVAPRAGAWIETRMTITQPTNWSRSHPVRVRGLKLAANFADTERGWSHPVRVRGLKPLHTPCNLSETEVAPRAGAWIETKIARHHTTKGVVAPRAGAWIETGTSV